jgi:N-acetylneuraminate synthase
MLFSNNELYFIADIAANHDGSLTRAKKLIRLCAKAGANAAKFQHFKAETIVSDYGFKKLGKLTHQKKWKKSVYETYSAASINPKWNYELLKECKKNKIDFMTSPYDLNYVDEVYEYIRAYKIGSGDITWKEIIKKIAKKNKPTILATGASNLKEVLEAVKEILKFKKKLVLMQCNTNYTKSNDNFKFINLNVIKLYKKIFKDKIILGLSDHTVGHTTVLGAITLGARVIEKHFTDDNNRSGPDHNFSMNPISWKSMVDNSKALIKALGDGTKKIEFNEKESAVVQRRAIWSLKDIKKGDIIKKNMIICLRPCPKGALSPFYSDKIIGKKARQFIKKNSFLTKKCVIL